MNSWEGIQVGNWTILNFSRKTKYGQKYFFCKCKCEKIKEVRLCELKSGKTKSCSSCSNSKNATKHGLSSSKEFLVWVAIKARCLNLKNDNYSRYGGRGIKVCDRWLESFTNFYEDMGPKPFEQAQIDRIDVEGNYEPSNCRWVTPKQNANNRRNNKKVNKDTAHA